MKRTPMVRLARWRFAALWLSQVARVLADCLLRIFVLFELIRGRGWEDDQAWQVVTALLMLPAVFLAPLIGAISNALPKHLALGGSAAYCFAVVTVFGFAYGSWLACWAGVAVGAAVYRPTRDALLPAASGDG